MGAVCSGRTLSPSTQTKGKSSSFSENFKKLKSFGSFGKQRDKCSSDSNADEYGGNPQIFYSGELPLSISRELRPSSPDRTQPRKLSQKSCFLGSASIMGFARAVEVLDALVSSMSNLNTNSGFATVTGRGNKISILAFEVANTIAKGANLMQSLSEENFQFLKKEILLSEGVQRLVSTDIQNLMSFVAADKREEFDIFSREVIRFGDLCKGPQWHNLGRYFSNLASDAVVDKQDSVVVAETIMQELTNLAQNTSNKDWSLAVGYVRTA